MTSQFKRVACYCRVSTNLQSSGLEAQERAIKGYCEQNNITGFQLFKDEGISGTKSSRPGLDDMMKQVKAGEISTVIVYSFSRFARSTTHLLSALAEFKKLGVSFTSITERIDTNSPLGIAFFTILASLAQLERDLIAERVRCGLANARAKGKHIGRKKIRNSELIRALLKSGMTYRQAAIVANTSHGSIHAEKKAMIKEEKEAKLKVEADEKAKLEGDATVKDKIAEIARLSEDLKKHEEYVQNIVDGGEKAA